MIPELISRILNEKEIVHEQRGDFDEEKVDFVLGDKTLTFILENQQLYFNSVSNSLMNILIAEINQRIRDGYFEYKLIADGQTAQWIRNFSIGI